jgi:L-fuconate dehydratase
MITKVTTRDARYPIGSGHGSDAIHKDPIYSYAVTLLHDDQGHAGTGLAFTLGEGNQLVCEAAKFYAAHLQIIEPGMQLGQSADENILRAEPPTP